MMEGRHLRNDTNNKGDKVNNKMILVVVSIETCKEKENNGQSYEHFPLMAPLLTPIYLLPVSFPSMFTPGR